MKKFKVMIALLSSMTLLSCNFSTCLQASAVMRYYSDSIVSSENILISATDVVRVISENETYLSFANLTGRGRILCLSNRPDSDEELISAITGLNNNTRYCYIEEENCILHYNYNTKNIETTEYDTAVKYTIDLINGVIISEETGEEISKFTTGSSYFVYDSENPDAKGEYPVYEMINYGEAGILSSTTLGTVNSSMINNNETKVCSSVTPISSTDVVRVISENETYLSFANLTGKGRILCLSNRPDSDEELISAITGLNNNTRYCYIEEENCILHYNYNTKNIETTEYDTAVKYTIDLINGVIISEETGEEVSKFTTGSSYFVYDSENPDAKGEYPVYEMINYGEAGILSPLASVSKINYGNFNEDNIVDLTDLTELSLYLLGDKEFADTQILAADVNADGNVNIADLAYLRLYLNGTEDLKLGR